jgi:tetratricopeptide (TPR) repeat protein
VYEAQGRYTEAEPLQIAALEGRKRELGAEHPSTLYSMMGLAELRWGQGRYEEGERLFVEALEALKRVLGDKHPNTLRCTIGLADLYSGQGRHEEARPLVEMLVSLFDGRPGIAKTNPGLKDRYASLMLTCEPSELQDPQVALRFALEANEMTGFEIAVFLDTLALAYHRTGQTATAIETQRKALALLPERETHSRAEFEQRLAEFEAALNREE